MQVRYGEGVANHIDPEPCAVVRKDGGEASVGERTGQPLSLAKIVIPGADAVANAEGNTDGRETRAPRRPGVVEEPGMCGSSLHPDQALVALVRIGKVRSRSR